MGKIVSMGGGELRHEDTLMLDKRVIELTGKARPNALFIPTASGDAVGYYDHFRHIYAEKLGCKTDVLYLIDARPSPAEIASRIMAADLIYVGGGNTLRMMKLWRKSGVDQLLKAAHERGTVLSGLSAGAICWFAYGHSDSQSFSRQGEWQYIRVRGLGLINAIYCPHVDSEKRLPNFMSFMQKYSLVGIGCDDCCAIEIIDDSYRIIAAREGAKAYKLLRQRGEVVKQIMMPHNGYKPLVDLLTK